MRALFEKGAAVVRGVEEGIILKRLKNHAWIKWNDGTTERVSIGTIRLPNRFVADKLHNGGRS